MRDRSVEYGKPLTDVEDRAVLLEHLRAVEDVVGVGHDDDGVLPIIVSEIGAVDSRQTSVLKTYVVVPRPELGHIAWCRRNGVEAYDLHHSADRFHNTACCGGNVTKGPNAR